MHWCKDSKAISDLSAVALGHQDIQHIRSFSEVLSTRRNHTPFRSH